MELIVPIKGPSPLSRARSVNRYIKPPLITAWRRKLRARGWPVPRRQRSPAYFLPRPLFPVPRFPFGERRSLASVAAPNESRRHASCGGRNSISRLCRTSMLLGKQLSANALASETKSLRLFTGLLHGGCACRKCRLHERPALCETAHPFPRKP